MVELLSPAGSYEGFLAALKAGADAVYAGGELFGARAYAKNFTKEELLKAIDVSHLHSRKLYLTVNTLCKEAELEGMYDYIRPFYEQGLDGVIVQDTGVAGLIRHYFPGLNIHASTQMTITGLWGARYAKSLGMTRVVPARELSLDEIRKIRQECDIELECFIHGAMCYSYSGQCLFSGFLGGRSGNRGRCAQPCRLEYAASLVRSDGREELLSRKSEPCLLSMRDMCTVNILPELIEAGITSFKIEGRMKKPEYTYFATSVYRKYIDLYESGGRYEVSRGDIEALAGNYMRTELSQGYYHTYNGRELITLRKSGYNEHDIALPELQMPPLRIRGRAYFAPGQAAELELSCGGHSVKACGDVCQEPVNSPLDTEKIRQQLLKTGGSGFEFEELSVENDEAIFLPVKALNELRRAALESLREELLSDARRSADITYEGIDPGKDSVRGAAYGRMSSQQESGSSTDSKTGSSDAIYPVADAEPGGCTVLCESTGQLNKTLAFADKISRIYIECDLWLNERETVVRLIKDGMRDAVDAANDRFKCKIYLALPYILRAKDGKKLKEMTESAAACGFIEGFLVRNYEELMLLGRNEDGFGIVADFGLYSFNSVACRELFGAGADMLTIPLELSDREMASRGALDLSELVIYGRAPMMISAGCVKKTVGACTKGNRNADAGDSLYLLDRYKKRLPVITSCRFCYNRILNAVPTFIDVQPGKDAPGYLRIQFSDETADESHAILTSILSGRAVEKSHSRGKNARSAPGGILKETTRGHFRKGVE